MLSFAVGNSFFRPKTISTVVVCFLLLLTTACSQGSNNSKVQAENVSPAVTTLRIGYVGSAEPTGPLGWAKKQGILERELQKSGFQNITFARFGNGPDLNESLVAGQIDVGFLGDTPAIVLKARGIDTRLLRITQFNNTAWLVAKKNGANSLTELKGQRIATQKGSYMHRYLLGLLDQTKLAKDVKVVHLMSTEAKSALERGDIAAYATSSDMGPFLKSQGFPIIDSSADHQGLSGTSLVVATEKFLAQKPDFPQKFNTILTTSVKDLKANSEEYYKYHAQTSKYPVNIIKTSYPLNQVPEEPFPSEGVKLLEGTKNFLVAQKLAKSDFALSDWMVK
ncbi:ABC transporter substrate-binding protein [Nostoc sp. FACHB-87]|uniref:ABC transporter substrate-binding protein n=1 Tax=Nostocales TaxID=1161 RepID=UPI001681DF9C|nr:MULTISPECIES: ABC transporter substrate-binding protein [Nostocales]MBD2454495.1 ABC transporter substrate-binding protein [Nostoc sp. FACHB-87]MBD2474319.1 ABC transporter substrate-binding protein [Anabaena sp. FACHB-83]MBD2487135.1 ABC transporter substrate-binding protein [Aulosira sp. FACHB-615]